MSPRSFFYDLPNHRGSGRAVRIGLGDISTLSPPEVGQRFVLLCAEDADSSSLTPEHARTWVDAGAAFVCSWGGAAEQIEESFDYSVVLPELGELDWQLMTSAHGTETLGEALWFAFYNAFEPDERREEIKLVVITTNRSELAAACERWVLGNTE